MRYTTYRYNSATCQYERVKVRVKNVLWYSLGVAVTGASLLCGLLILHDVIINTETEKKLRKENHALKEHHQILSTHLSELQPTLIALQDKDHVLHNKFFGSPPLIREEKLKSTSKENVLLADPVAFRSIVSSIQKTSAQLLKRSSSNQYFQTEIILDKEKRKVIASLPTHQPFDSWQRDNLISGFGMRINPYHKGLYEHLGIDIALPRGTPVLATAAGTIKELKRSDLQAGYGNYIEIEHDNKIMSRYAHLEDISVRYGEKVAKGDVIGTVGTSGGSIAPHLHYEILINGKNVDPIYYMVEGMTSSQHEQLTWLSHQQNQSLD